MFYRVKLEIPTGKADMKQFVFQKGMKYYLVEISVTNQVTLKLKEDGWSDTWSLPIEQVGP